MGYVNQPYRVLYESKGFQSGLNIRAVVFKPDKTIAGPFIMSEMPGMLGGRYYFDYIPSASDQLGEYFVGIYPPDVTQQTTLRMAIYPAPIQPSDISGILSELEELSDAVDLISACVL